MPLIDYINQFLEKWKEMITLSIFLMTYLCVAIGQGKKIRLDRTGFALLGAFTMVTLGCLGFNEAVGCIDFRTLALVFTLMLISSQLHYAGFYSEISRYFARFLDKPKMFLFVMMMSTAVASSFFNNTIIALAFAPLLASVLIQKGLNPVPFLMGLCMTNNGCLTIIGNPQNILVGQLGHIDFMDYTLYAFVPVMASALACYGVCVFLGRNHLYLRNDRAVKVDVGEAAVPFNLRGTFKGLGTLLLMVLLFIFTDWDRGMISLSIAGFLLCSQTLSSHEILSRVDWQTILLFIGLFVVVGAFNLNGLGMQMVDFLTARGLDLTSPVTMAVSATALSNVINNTAAVMLLGNIVDLAEYGKTAYALALSNALTGNLILVGSLSNMVIIRVVERAGAGQKITFKLFFHYGLPCTALSLLILTGWLYFV